MSRAVIKLADASRRLRLKKMQIAGYLAHASAQNRVLVGFYRDETGKIRPVTKSIREVKNKKIVQYSARFNGVRPKSKANAVSTELLKKARSPEAKRIATDIGTHQDIYSDASPYLKPDEDFDSVVARDTKILKRYKLTHAQVATELEKLIRSEDYAESKGVVHHIGGAYKGYEDCPFGCKVRTSVDHGFEDRVAGKTFTVSGLMPHLIRKHKFFEGNVRYRLDPILVAKIIKRK